jgi:hypothetical protein
MRLQELTRCARFAFLSSALRPFYHFTEFEPIIVEVRDVDGHVGWRGTHFARLEP